MDYTESCIIDYGKYIVEIKPLMKSKSFQTKISMINSKYAKREMMIEKNMVSKEFAEKVKLDKEADIVKLYCDDIIVSFKTDKGVDYSNEEIAAFLVDEDNSLMASDIIDQALIEANFLKEVEKEAEKN